MDGVCSENSFDGHMIWTSGFEQDHLISFEGDVDSASLEEKAIPPPLSPF